MDIQNWLIEWFVENSFAGRDELLQGLEQNYFECGWLDSLGFITLLDVIEEQFGIEFDNDAFEDRDFSTIVGLAKILEKLI